MIFVVRFVVGFVVGRMGLVAVFDVCLLVSNSQSHRTHVLSDWIV